MTEPSPRPRTSQLEPNPPQSAAPAETSATHSRAAAQVGPSWWQRNRLALALILPLAALAMLSASYPLFVVYLPNRLSRPQRGYPTVQFKENFRDVGFGREPKWYPRHTQITLKTITQSPLFKGERAAKDATLWVVGLEFQADPQTMLKGCHIFLVDGQGRIYDDIDGKKGFPEGGFGCVPQDTPGPEIDFQGQVATTGSPRPNVWTVQRTVAVPVGREPVSVRVAWQPPHYAEIPVKEKLIGNR